LSSTPFARQTLQHLQLLLIRPDLKAEMLNELRIDLLAMKSNPELDALVEQLEYFTRSYF
jgi:hypothetical protein